MPFDVLIYENSSLHLQRNVNHIRLQNRQDSVPTCFAEGRAVVAEAILRNVSKKYRGSSRRQCFSGSIRGSSGCLHGSYAEGFEVRLYLQQVHGQYIRLATVPCVASFFFATLHAPTFCLVFQRIRLHVRCFSPSSWEPVSVQDCSLLLVDNSLDHWQGLHC